METPAATPSIVSYDSKQSALKSKSPQGLVFQFWSDYHSKTPGRVTSVLPPNNYELIPESELPHSTLKTLTYKEAVQQCRDDVRAIVKDCKRTNNKFTDPEFDIEKDFLNSDYNCLFGLSRVSDGDGDDEITKPGSVHRIPWIFNKPEFVTNGFNADIKQGTSSNCWWLAALVSVTSRKDLIEKLCIARNEDCGVYGFVFHGNGGWIPTVVDDNLYLTNQDFDYDLYDGSGNRAQLYKEQKQTGSEALFFSKCRSANETWLPLLEKAVSNTKSYFSTDLIHYSLQKSTEITKH